MSLPAFFAILAAGVVSTRGSALRPKRWARRGGKQIQPRHPVQIQHGGHDGKPHRDEH